MTAKPVKPLGSRAMRRPRFLEIDGRSYLWRDLVQRYRAQGVQATEQPTLFPLREDRRALGERNAAERYCAPSLFTLLERPP